MMETTKVRGVSEKKRVRKGTAKVMNPSEKERAVPREHIGQRFDIALIARWNTLRAMFESSDACLEHVLNLAQQPQQSVNGHVQGLDGILTLLDFSDSERELVTDALGDSALPWQHLFKMAILAKMRATSKGYTAKTIDDVDITDPKARWHVRGAATARCRQVFDEVVAANQAATSMAGKRYITRSLITDLAQCSPTIAIRFCEANAEEIAAHNEAMGFRDAQHGKTHNQYVYKRGHSDKD